MLNRLSRFDLALSGETALFAQTPDVRSFKGIGVRIGGKANRTFVRGSQGCLLLGVFVDMEKNRKDAQIFLGRIEVLLREMMGNV